MEISFCRKYLTKIYIRRKILILTYKLSCHHFVKTLILIIFFYEIYFSINRPDIEIQGGKFCKGYENNYFLWNYLSIRTKIAVHLLNKILVRKCWSDDLGVRRLQKDLNSYFALPEGFRIFCRSVTGLYMTKQGYAGVYRSI